MKLGIKEKAKLFPASADEVRSSGKHGKADGRRGRCINVNLQSLISPRRAKVSYRFEPVQLEHSAKRRDDIQQVDESFADELRMFLFPVFIPNLREPVSQSCHGSAGAAEGFSLGSDLH